LQYKIRLYEKLIHVVALCEGVQQEENERDDPFRQFAKIKTIFCLCAKRKFVHKGHAHQWLDIVVKRSQGWL
jgi:hypothetical protein